MILSEDLKHIKKTYAKEQDNQDLMIADRFENLSNGTIFDEKIKNLEHVRHKENGKQYSCKFCLKKFQYPTKLEEHERIHIGDKPFACKYCEKKFTHLHHLQGHERVHSGERPYKCTYCDKNFRTLQQARKHERTHTGEK